MAVYTYKTKKGKQWRVQRTVTKNGERKNFTKKGFSTEKEAKNYDIELAYALKQDNLHLKSITLDTVFEEYLIDKKKEVSIVWFNKINQLYNDYIYPTFGNQLLDKITTIDIIRWKRKLDELGLSLNYKRKIFTQFSSIIKYGMLCFDLKENVLQKVGNFKCKNTIKRTVTIWQENEVTQFLNAFDNPNDYVYYAFFATLIYTGMRNCEAFALQWQDINFEENTIHINKSLSQKVKGVRNYIGTTKTLSSYRIIYMPKELHSTLCTLQAVALEKAIHHKNNYVFSINGTLPIAETTMNKRRIKYSIKANVPVISCHKIRHTHISHLIANGANPMAVANRVGHVSTKMTLDTYGHSINKADKELLTIISTSYARVE